jgi:hypothetical protein
MLDRKAKMLRNIALREHARMPVLIKRQHVLQDEISQLVDLIARIADLQVQDRRQGDLDPRQLQSDRWYELQLVDESALLQNKLEFLQVELRDLTAAINRMSHKKRVVSNKADEVERQVSEDRDAQSDAAQDFIRATRQV